MKKSIFIAITFVAILTASCTNDFTEPKALADNTWRCNNFSVATMATEFEYYEFKFISPTTLEVWAKLKSKETPEKANQSYVYVMEGNSITISFNGKVVTGTLDKTKMSVSEDGIVLDFYKI